MKYPEKSVIFLSLGNMGLCEHGFFCIHFGAIFNLRVNIERTNLNEDILKDFTSFINISEIEMKYTSDNLLRLYKTLTKMKKLLFLDLDFDKNQREMKQMNKTDFFYYIDLFIKILNEHFDKKNKN